MLSYRMLLHLDPVQVTCDIRCVTGWTLLDSEWTGGRLKTVLDVARPRTQAGFIVFKAAGDYPANVPISDADKENVVLAHRFIGEPLPPEYGAPVRVIVPDRYFYKSAKWLEGIKVTVHLSRLIFSLKKWSEFNNLRLVCPSPRLFPPENK